MKNKRKGGAFVMKKSRLKMVIIISVMAAIILVYYYNLSTKRVEKHNSTKQTKEITKLLAKNLEESYPKTPREVIKLYSRIITCFYSGSYTEDEKKLLAVQVQKLMDDELLKHNDFDEYYDNLCADIEQYEKENKVITSYVLDSGSNVEYKILEEKNYAILKCLYYTKGKEGVAKTNQQYILRKDETGKWKILYWKLFDSEEDSDE